MTRSTVPCGVFLAALLAASAAVAQTPPARPSLKALESVILDKAPQTRVEAVDHERITARRIDIVGQDGTIRMTLSGETPAPIIDGIQYRRAFNVSGLDHPAMDAIGWRVASDGAVSFQINQAPPLLREPALGDKLVPGVATSTRVKLSVAADGTPAVALADAADRTRVRMTVTPEGYGAIEFLDAQGKVIHVLAPEAGLAKGG